MQVTITKLRQDLFRLVDQALEGEPLEFVHKGILFKVIPEKRSSKLERLTPETVMASSDEWDHSALMKEMEDEWEKDWAEL